MPQFFEFLIIEFAIREISIEHFFPCFCRHDLASSSTNFNIIESEFSPSPSEREAALRNRKEQLFLNAKKKYLERRLVN